MTDTRVLPDWAVSEPYENSGIGGDDEVGEGWAVRYTRPDTPAFVESTYFVFGDSDDENELPATYGVENVVLLMVGESVDDIIGTCINGAYEYTTQPPIFDSLGAAEAYAKSQAQWEHDFHQHTPLIHWDGQPKY